MIDRLAVRFWRSPVEIPFGARPIAPLILWLGAAAAATASESLAAAAPLALAGAGALVALLTLRGALGARIATAAAVLPAGLSGQASRWLILLAGGVVAAVVASRNGPLTVRSHDLKRHIDWCRRRDEKAQLLVMRVPAEAFHRSVNVLDAFRLTDSVTVTRQGGICEVEAVLDDLGFSRNGLERRLSEAVNAEPEFGWATFPDDGITLAVLLEAARRDAVRQASTTKVRSTIGEPSLASAEAV